MLSRIRDNKDKPKVEKSVGDLETWVMAALRNITFFSFAELNVAIRKKLAEFSDRPYQKLEGSRRSVFLEQDQPALRRLPAIPYDLVRQDRSVCSEKSGQFDRNIHPMKYGSIRKSSK